MAPPPVALSNTNFTFYQDVAYGEHIRQRIDLFLPNSASPAGLIVYFHGGGLVSGDKQQTYELPYLRDRIDQYLWANVAFATVNYRLSNDDVTYSAKTSFRDGVRSLQFLRHYSQELGIDPARAVAMGSSAGGAMALYIATRDDLANPEANQLEERQSSRVSGTFAYIPQAGYNIPRWQDTMFARFKGEGLTTERIIELARPENVRSWLGLTTLTAIDAPATRALRAEVDILSHISGDDPELYLDTDYPMNLPADYATLMHHPLHAVALLNEGEKAGVSVLAHIPDASIDTTQNEKFFDWSLRKVGAR